MYRELLKIPFTDLTVKSYGTMMVIGFLAAVYVMQRLSRRSGLDPVLITNAALYSLVAGVVGARIFFVIHYRDEFDSFLSVFALWRGGLEFLGGVVLAIVFLVFYLRKVRQPVCRALDVMAVGLMLALAFGRIGCFLNGCCYGKPADLPWAVRFPYGSFAYESQINANPQRGRLEPHLRLPDSFFGYLDAQGQFNPGLKPLADLTPEQREQVTHGEYRCLPVHPSQLYASLSALAVSLILYGLWRRGRAKPGSWSARPGMVFSTMFILYGLVRFLLEFSRDDNPFEWGILTISQILGLGLIGLGVTCILINRSWPKAQDPTAR